MPVNRPWPVSCDPRGRSDGWGGTADTPWLGSAEHGHAHLDAHHEPNSIAGSTANASHVRAAGWCVGPAGGGCGRRVALCTRIPVTWCSTNDCANDKPLCEGCGIIAMYRLGIHVCSACGACGPSCGRVTFAKSKDTRLLRCGRTQRCTRCRQYAQRHRTKRRTQCARERVGCGGVGTDAFRAHVAQVTRRARPAFEGAVQTKITLSIANCMQPRTTGR